MVHHGQGYFLVYVGDGMSWIRLFHEYVDRKLFPVYVGGGPLWI